MRTTVGTIVLVALAAGCGSAATSGSAGGTGTGTTGAQGLTIAAIASDTVAAHTAHIEGTLESSVPDAAEHETFHGDADFAHYASDITYSDSNATGTRGGEMRVVGDNTYLHSTEGEATSSKFVELATGDGFAPITGDSLGGDSTSASPIVGWAIDDPVGAIDELRALAARTNDLDAATVDGVATRRQVVTTTIGALFGCTGAATADDEDGPCAASMRHDHATLNVWVDSKSRLVRLDAVLDFGADGKVESRVDYSGFGAPVQIAAPPKSQLLDTSQDFGPIP
jgi:hypothetical protein